MSKLVFIGDVHGHIDSYRDVIRELSEDTRSIQLGDMGLGFRGVFLYPGGSMASGRHKFIRGNHDSPSACRKHPHYLGDYGYLKELGLFYLGGAWSIDQAYRTEDVSWWRDEELSAEELARAWDLYKDAKPRIVATHEAPSLAAVWMLTQLTLPYSAAGNPTTVVHDENYKYYKEKLGCVNTRTSQKLQEMLDVHTPERWYFGHYHATTAFNLRGCDFRCLGELATDTYEL